MKYQSALIISYGRSGSTLLSGLLNSIDGCVINGENNNFIYHLFRSYQSLIVTKARPDLDPTHPWYGSSLVDLDQFILSIGRVIKKQLLGDR